MEQGREENDHLASMMSDPLPEVPFVMVSGTIGMGAYAFIRQATPPDRPNPVIAVKFINHKHAYRVGGVSPQQWLQEITLHRELGNHKNIIAFLGTGGDKRWTWIAMELAQGGDLFDKIEPDRGISENIAHIYFKQLINAVRYMHSMGIAHRDIKPENILLDMNGNLKLADFGLATLFEYKGQKKMSKSSVGSPPYMARELIIQNEQTPIIPYDPTLADIWSCGVVLFVLLCGNTPWHEPTVRSEEFIEYQDLGGKGPDDDPLWQSIKPMPLSLIYGMLKLDPKDRYKTDRICIHPWFVQPNDLLTPSGMVSDPVTLATQMMENLRVDLTREPAYRPAPVRTLSDAMDVDEHAFPSATQPDYSTVDSLFNMTGIDDMPSNTQPVGKTGLTRWASSSNMISHTTRSILENEVTLSQFSVIPSVPLSRTQAARNFIDIAPAHTAANFFSDAPLNLLSSHVGDSLHLMGARAVRKDESAGSSDHTLRVTALDRRRQPLKGSVTFRQIDDGVHEVVFQKAKGCPLEWRELFKQVAIRCKDLIITQDML